LSSKDIPVTQGIRFLREKKIDFVSFLFRYEEKGGTQHTAIELNVPEHNVVKTLVFEDENGKGLIVLMHGDMEVSVKELARILGVKTVSTCSQQKAMKYTGYQFGGTSPFGTRTVLPVFVEETIFLLEEIYINGGKQGFILEMNPIDLRRTLDLVEVNVAIKK